MEYAINAEYFQLRKLVEQEGLLESSPCFYVGQVAIALALFAVSVTLIVFYEGFWGQMINATLLAFTYGQLGFLMHDVGHNQVVGVHWLRSVGMFFNVLIGWSTMWWVEKHNVHHKAPNQNGLDRDIVIRFLAFTEVQAREKRGLYRVITRYQHILFLVLLLGELWHLRYAAVKYLLGENTGRARVDISLIVIHMTVYLGVLFFFLPPWHALAFVAVHTGLTGVYLGMAFAPNHIGMRIVKPGEVPDYLRKQVLTTRDVRGGWFITFLFGGLNFQIVHHLFPKMSRKWLKQATLIVERFCEEKGVLYCSVSLWESYKQVFGHLREMAMYAT